MSELFAADQGAPADGPDVVVSCPAGQAWDVVVRYRGGELWWLRSAQQGDPPAWQPLGAPPSNAGVAFAVGWAAASGAGVVALGAGDRELWAATVGAPGWIALGSPGEAEAVLVSVLDLPGAPVPTRVVALVDWQETLWVRTDRLDDSVPDPAAWQQVAPLPGWGATAVGMVATAGADGPTAHLVASVRNPVNSMRRLVVLRRDGEAWQLVDPGGPPGDVDVSSLVVGAVSGRGLAAVRGFDHFGGIDTGTLVLEEQGGGWTWRVLGQPSDSDRGDPVAIAAVVDPAHGDDPTVLVLTPSADGGSRLWRAGRDGAWSRIPGPDGDPAVRSLAGTVGGHAPGSVAVASGDGSTVWSLALRGSSPGWTELPALPGAVADVVGGLADWDDPTAPEPAFQLFTVGAEGSVWARLWNGSRWIWRDHGRPAPDVAARSGVGAVASGDPAVGSSAVVVGSDGAVWVRSRTGAEWSWTTHGSPGGQPPRAVAPPVLVPGPPEQQLQLVAAGRDGQLWVRSHDGGGWRWQSRGAPPGTTVFGLLGATAAGPPTGGGTPGLVAFVITDDGGVWGSWVEGASPRWTSLGVPGPGLAAVAGLGIVPVPPAQVRVLVLDGTQRHVRATTWPPGAWTDVPPPAGTGVAGSLGAIADPADPGCVLAYVPGTDGRLRILRLPAAGATWTDAGPLPATGRVRGRAVVAPMLHHSFSFRRFPVAAYRTDDGRLGVAWPD